MPDSPVSKNIAFKIMLALTSKNIAGHDEQNHDARLLGLTGAEIDAARDGRCFDVRGDAAIKLACAFRDGEVPAIERQKILAKRAGLDEAACAEIYKFTLQITSRS